MGFDYGAGGQFYISAYIKCAEVQPDGKIIIGANGYLPYYNSTQVLDKPFRINANGTIDTSFNFNPSLLQTMVFKRIVLQPDGKIIFIGNFSFYFGLQSYGSSIFRLNSDGSIDASFMPNLSPGYQSVNDCVVQPDGKIIVGGKFTSTDGVTTNAITRLNNDGTLDPTFNAGGNGALFGLQGVNSVDKIKIQPDGKIVILGNFGAYNGVARKNIARLNTDGTLDLTFNPGTGFDDVGSYGAPILNSIAFQDDGKFLVGGLFSSYNGVTNWSIVRINTDGFLDSSFATGLGIRKWFVGPISGTLYDYPGIVRDIVVQADERIILGGYFERYNGVDQTNIASINPDGSLDGTFHSGTGIPAGYNYLQDANNKAGVHDLTIMPNQRILISSDSSVYDNTFARGLAMIDSFGNLDLSFNSVTSFDESVYCSAIQSDGKILVGGLFTKYYSEIKRGIVRLNSDGSLDNTFNIGSGIYESLYVKSIIIQPDNKIIVAGAFNSFNGSIKHSIVRLNADGTIGYNFQSRCIVCISNIH